METRLIMLSQPILVSDENIEAKTHYLTKDLTFAKGSVSVPKNLGRKIIAGIEGLPKIDLSLIAEKIGWVDVEKLAEEKYPIQKGGSAWMPTTHDCIQANKQEGFIEGFKAAQSLNEKKYSENEMIDFHNFVFRHPNQYLTMGEYLNEFKQSIKPKEYLVEVEMEWLSNDNEEHCVYFEKQSKITHNTIKVTKIL